MRSHKSAVPNGNSGTDGSQTGRQPLSRKFDVLTTTPPRHTTAAAAAAAAHRRRRRPSCASIQWRWRCSRPCSRSLFAIGWTCPASSARRPPPSFTALAEPHPWFRGCGVNAGRPTTASFHIVISQHNRGAIVNGQLHLYSIWSQREIFSRRPSQPITHDNSITALVSVPKRIMTPPRLRQQARYATLRYVRPSVCPSHAPNSTRDPCSHIDMHAHASSTLHHPVNLSFDPLTNLVPRCSRDSWRMEPTLCWTHTAARQTHRCGHRGHERNGVPVSTTLYSASKWEFARSPSLAHLTPSYTRGHYFA